MLFKVGDIVQLQCPTLLHNTRNATDTIIGKIVAIFDALYPDGSTGNLEYDITYNSNKWIRYIPNKDAGTLTLIERDIND
jgi:hypothetical protein